MWLPQRFLEIGGKMIVKVQTPLMTNENPPLALIYNKSRSLQVQVPISGYLKSKMRGRPKVFFHAKFNEKKIEIGSEAPWQDW